jgi:acetyl-CoA C-acetyltransferase
MNTLGLFNDRVNVNGGNLALGYPIGATGLRMSVSLLYEMKKKQVEYGMSVMCAGGNMANGVIFKNIHN